MLVAATDLCPRGGLHQVNWRAVIERMRSMSVPQAMGADVGGSMMARVESAGFPKLQAGRAKQPAYVALVDAPGQRAPLAVDPQIDDLGVGQPGGDGQVA